MTLRLVVLSTFACSAILAANASAITIVASSDVVAAECCNTGTVKVYNGLQISDSNKKWANEPFSHMWLATASWCDLTYNYFQETCCITSTGNYRLVSTTISATCPIEAQGRSYGWIGGYGDFAYKEDEADSMCVLPCYCGGGGGGEEDPWEPCHPEDIFCY